MKLADSLRHLNFYILLGVVLLLPLFFLPITAEFYEFNKQALLILAAGLSLLFWSASSVIDRQVRIVRSPLGLPLLALLAAWMISALLVSPNRFDAFLGPGQTGIVASLIILFFTGVNSLRTRRQLDALLATYLTSFSLLGLVIILWASGLMGQIIPVDFLKSPLWTPTGNSLATLVVLALQVPFITILLFKDRSESVSKTRLVLLLVSLLVCAAGASLLTYRLFLSDPSSRPVFLPQAAGWAIAMESLKASPLFGTGPDTFLSDFTRFRPISYNLTPVWAVRFASSSNYYLQLLATVGIFGLLSYLVLASRIFRLFTRSFKATSESYFHALALAATASALIFLIVQALVPTSVVPLSAFFFLLILATAAFKFMGSSQVYEANIDIVASADSGARSPLLPWIAFVVSLAVVVPGLFFAGRLYGAEVLYRRALLAATRNEGKTTYDTLIAAIRIFPYKDTYRISYSQTNLLLANSIASGKKELTPEERTTISRLIQQAIREAKNAVTLNPFKVSNVENLAGIYRSLLNLAQGADVWTVASYRQAIALDPVNPNLRIAYGGIFFGQKNYDEAIRLFQSAVDLKPDHANAYYNLSAAYREKGDLPRAVTALATVVNLVPKDSADYTKVLAELDELKKKAGEAAPVSAGPSEPAKTDLQAPAPLPTSQISPPLELPSDLGPESTPSPEPTIEPAPSQ